MDIKYICTVEACDVDQIVCEQSKKYEKEESRTFILPIISFDVTVKFVLFSLFSLFLYCQGSRYVRAQPYEEPI
jgi:hypothetical protein